MYPEIIIIHRQEHCRHCVSVSVTICLIQLITMSTITERKRKESKDLDDKAITSDKSDEGKKVQVIDGENMPGQASNEAKKRLVLAVHFCNVCMLQVFGFMLEFIR